MAGMKSGLVLSEGETLLMELEEELWSTSSNPIARFFGAIRRIIAKILGTRIKSFLVITNKRVVEINDTIKCYCFNTSKEVKYVLPSSVKEVGYKRYATCGCLCPAYRLYYDAHTQYTEIMLSGVNEEGAQKVVDAFYAAIKNAQIGV